MPEKIKDKLVSIIIPFYNLGEYLEEAIKSCLNQTYKNIEIIVVNDGSTDEKSLKVLSKLKIKYQDRVKFIDQKNQGVGKTRNNGIKVSKGEYICCLDADDKYSPSFVKKTLNKILKNKNNGIITTYTKLFGDTNSIWKNRPYKDNLIFTENVIHVASLFRKKIWEEVGGYDEKLIGYQDWDFWIKIIGKGYVWKLIPEALFFYRKRGKSMNDNSTSRRQDILREIIKNNIKVYKNKFPEVIVNLDTIKIEQQNIIDKLYQKLDNFYSTHKSTKYNLLLVCDVNNWAFGNIANSIKYYLKNDFEITIKYVVDYPSIQELLKEVFLTENYDLVHFFWRLVPLEILKTKLEDRNQYILYLENVTKTCITTSVYDHAFIDKDSVNIYYDKFKQIIDYYTVSSKKLSKIYSRIGKYGKPKATIQDGVNLHLFSPKNIKRFSIQKKQELIIGWVGNSKWSINKNDDIKGVNTIIKPALQSLQKEGYKVKEFFADRNEKQIPIDQMSNYYSKIDILVCASKIEGTPNPVLEAMACGVPIISTDVGIVPEIFGSTQKQYIIKRNIDSLKESIKYLYDHKEILKELSKENLIEIKKHTREKEAKKWKKFFTESIENKSKSNNLKKMATLTYGQYLESGEKYKLLLKQIRIRKTILKKFELGLYLKKIQLQ